MTFDEMLLDVKGMTHDNCHTESLITVCKYFNLTYFVKILEHLREIRKIEMSMPYELVKYQYRLHDRILKAIELGHGEEVALKVKSVL